MVDVSYAPLVRQICAPDPKLFYDEQNRSALRQRGFFQRHNAVITNQKQRTEEWYHNVKNARAFCS